MIPDITISFGGRHPARILKAEALPWAQVVALFSKMAPEVDDKAAEGWYACAEFRPAYRDGENLLGRTALTLDYDHISKADVPKITGALAGLAFVAYTTYSHTAEKPRLRVVVPLARLATAEEFQAVSRSVAARAGIELAARESHTPAQMSYMPARKSGGVYKVLVGQGGPVAVDAVLAEYVDWRDRLSWPRRAEHDDISKDEIPPPPDTKPGIVGDFCRAFRVPDVVARFDLPYTPVSDGRWTYAHGSRPEGAVEYDGGLKLHSHHDTDPARGQNNAFDLVRLHRYGSLDAAVPPETPVTELPSYQAMCKLALEQPEVRSQIANGEFEEITTPPSKPQGTLVLAEGVEPVDRFRVIPAAEFSGGPPLEYHIAEILPDAELIVMYGESGSGKSFLALDMGCAITRGLAWRTLEVKHGGVIYIAAEGASGFRSRLRAYAHANGIDLTSLPGVISDAPNFTLPDEIAGTAAQILKWGRPRLIIVDTLSASTPGSNENSGEDMGLVVSHAKFLHRKTGATVLLIHHSGKDAAKGARGWSGLKAAADAEFEITRNGDFRSMRISKMKDGEDGKVFGFKLKTVPISIDESSCVIEHIDMRPAAGKPEVPPGRLQRSIFLMLKEISPNGESVDRDDLRAALETKRGQEFERKASFDAPLNNLLDEGWVFSAGKGTNRVSWTQLKVGDADE